MGRLYQGIGVGTQGVIKLVDGSNTFHIIYYYDIRTYRHKDVTYTSVVCDFKPHKSYPYRTQITIGENIICYPGNVGTNTAPLKFVKFSLNSVLLLPGARFNCFDIEIFILALPWTGLSTSASRFTTYHSNF